MEYFLELVGEQTIGWAAVVIGAVIFLYKCYKSMDKYYSDKVIREAEKDREFKEAMSQIKKNEEWHKQSIGIRSELNESIKRIDSKLDDVSNSLQELKTETKEDTVTTNRYRILRFDDEIRHDVKHTKEHFDQILEDISAYETYCRTHPNYKNNKAVLAIENIKSTYKRCAQEHTFL